MTLEARVAFEELLARCPTTVLVLCERLGVTP